MIFAVLSEAADKKELILVENGLCRWHLRRDGVLVIREVIVLPAARRQGIGSRMVNMACENHDGVVIAKCPKGYEANAFWQALGFHLVQEVDDVNVWQRNRS